VLVKLLLELLVDAGIEVAEVNVATGPDELPPQAVVMDRTPNRNKKLFIFMGISDLIVNHTTKMVSAKTI
jgi:hypothetical protein